MNPPTAPTKTTRARLDELTDRALSASVAEWSARFEAWLAVTKERNQSLDSRQGHQRYPNAPRTPTPDVPPQRVQDALDGLLGATGGTVRTVVELHAPVGRGGECEGCDFDGYDAERPDWPCRTIELIAEQVGVNLKEGTA